MKISQLLFSLFLFILIACFLMYCDRECQINETPDKVAYTIKVSQSGNGNFTTINDAINFIPSENNLWVKISLEPGIYNEQIKIQNKECIFLEGSDSATTIIAFDTIIPSIAFSNFANNNFIARGITFKNSHNRALEKGNAEIAPATAFSANGDRQAFYYCAFEGYQDTLWDEKGRHYFGSCYIEGATDFIWGNGQSVYEQCTINVMGSGWITAQGRALPDQTSGYAFRGCNIVGTGHADLGRAYNQFSRVIFIDSYFSEVVNPEGWSIWNQKGHENDVTYAEVNCKGPGANNPSRFPWIKKLEGSELEGYTTQAFIDQEGWIAKLPL